jgi:hypothetical protein
MRALSISLALSLALALVTGCSATLRSDGFYGCPEPDRSCPSGLVCHLSNHLCYHSPEDASVVPDGGSMPDTGMPMMPDSGTSSMCVPPCSGGQTCVMGQFQAGMPIWGCASGPAPANHGMACTGPSSCNVPDACLPTPAGGGPACMRPCDPHFGAAGCGFMEDCVDFGSMHTVCAHHCPAGCAAPLVCDAGRGFCLPPGW